MHRKPQWKHLYRQLINKYSPVFPRPAHSGGTHPAGHCVWQGPGGTAGGQLSPSQAASVPRWQPSGAASAPSYTFQLHCHEGKAPYREARKEKRANAQCGVICAPQHLLLLWKGVQGQQPVLKPTWQCEPSSMQLNCVISAADQTVNATALPVFLRTAPFLEEGWEDCPQFPAQSPKALPSVTRQTPRADVRRRDNAAGDEIYCENQNLQLKLTVPRKRLCKSQIPFMLTITQEQKLRGKIV